MFCDISIPSQSPFSAWQSFACSFLHPYFLSSLLPLPSSRDERPVTATPVHSVLTPHCFKPFNCNTYGSPRKCCKQKAYGFGKPLRCNRNPIRICCPQATSLV